jgi:spermidine synthase
MISAGGALGGLFVSLVAPQLFSTFFEWRIGLVVGCVLAAAVVLRTQSPNSLKRLYYSAPALVLLFVGFNYLPTLENQRRHEVNVASRNFYGVVRVIERDGDDPQQHRLQLYSGRIVHGVQFLDDAKRTEPTTYYGTETGIGRVFEFFGQQPDLRVGIIGLGAGTMAAYAQPGQTFRFYEINPDMVRLAKQYFHYLSDCQGETEIVLGDGRLSLEHEPLQHFDLLVLDAFSGDAIPAHLLTIEAFEVFRRQLKPQGTIAVHISNRYLNLAPVVCGVGKALDLTPLAFGSTGNPAASKFPAEWIVLSENPVFIARYPEAVATARQVRDLPHGCWTDDRSNLFEILK